MIIIFGKERDRYLKILAGNEVFGDDGRRGRWRSKLRGKRKKEKRYPACSCNVHE